MGGSGEATLQPAKRMAARIKLITCSCSAAMSIRAATQSGGSAVVASRGAAAPPPLLPAVAA